jgi:hypothetical protein
MNKYDSIDTFLNKPSSIIEDSNYMLNYINTYLYRIQNTEKTEEYYKSIPQILDKLFPISARIKIRSKQTKIFPTFVDNLDKGTLEDLDRALSLLLPNNLVKNIYTTVTNPPNHVPEYKLDASILGMAVNAILKQGGQKFILNLFQDLSKNLETQKRALENENIILNIFEYFLIYFLVAIRDYPGKNKINLPKFNENFTEMYRKSYKPINKEINYSLDLNRSVVFNFYQILFKGILDAVSESRSMDDLKVLIHAVDITWLSDYYIGDNILDYKFQDNIGIPNLMVLECLTHLIRSLQYNRIVPNDTLNPDALLFTIQRQLFHFIKQNFKKICLERLNTEVSINDIMRVWLTYITPWFEDGEVRFPVLQSYILFNLLFYTDLFNDYIISLANIGLNSQSVINSLNQVMKIYYLTDSGTIINSQLSLDLLKDMSLGTSSRSFIDTYNIIDNHMRYIGVSNRSSLYPFDKPENQNSAKIVYENLENWRIKLSKEMRESNRDLLLFLENLTETQETLLKLYGIDNLRRGLVNNYEDEFRKNVGANLLNSTPNIYSHRDIRNLTNPWKRKIANNESIILFHILKFIAYYIDRLKGIPIFRDSKGHVEPPVTDLRHYSNYYSLFSGLILVTIIYLMIRLIITLIKY